MGEHRPRRMLDQVRAYPELGEGAPPAFRAVALLQCRDKAHCMEQTWAAWIKRRIGCTLQPSEQDELPAGSQAYQTVPPTLTHAVRQRPTAGCRQAHVYLHAWQLTGTELYRTITEAILNYLVREMTDLSGDRYSTLAAMRRS